MTTLEPSHLLGAHSTVDRLLARIFQQALADDMPAVREGWHELTLLLRGHMAEEEATVLPQFSLEHPGDAAKIAGEHAVIRMALAAVEERLARGTARRDEVLNLVNLFRMHHYHEEAGMYRWARERRGAASEIAAQR